MLLSEWLMDDFDPIIDIDSNYTSVVSCLGD